MLWPCCQCSTMSAVGLPLSSTTVLSAHCHVTTQTMLPMNSVPRTANEGQHPCHHMWRGHWQMVSSPTTCSPLNLLTHVTQHHHERQPVPMPGEWETPQQGECPTTPWPLTPPSLTPRLQTRNHSAPRTANERRQHRYHVWVLPDQRTRVSAHATIHMVAWALGNGKLPHDLVDVETAHPQHRSTSLNDTNKEPHTQVNERGSAPMPHTWALGNWTHTQPWVCPYPHRHLLTNPSFANQEPQHTQDCKREVAAPMPHTWHGCWGIGNTPNKWVPHDAMPSSPPLLTPHFQTSSHVTLCDNGITFKLAHDYICSVITNVVVTCLAVFKLNVIFRPATMAHPGWQCERARLQRQDTTDVEMGITSMVRSHLLPNLDIYPLPIFSDDMISLKGFCLLSECRVSSVSISWTVPLSSPFTQSVLTVIPWWVQKQNDGWVIA